MRGGEQSALFQARCQARDGRYRWAKADLDMVAAATKGVDGYLIEIAGYASKTGTKEENQKLSEERAANVAQYLLEKGNIPMRRIMAPAGYGATHPAASNSDPQGRELIRRVDVKVLLNQCMAEGMYSNVR